MLALEEKYDSLLYEARKAWAAGSYVPDPPPLVGEPRWGLSLVAPIDGVVRERVTEDLGSIRSALSTQHFVYSPDNLHSTIMSLEGYQDDIPQEQIAYYVREAAEAVACRAQLEIRFHGLGGSRGGVFVCGYPNGELMQVRKELHCRATRNGPRAIASNDYKSMRDTAHVSLAVFQSPAVPEPAICDVVAERASKEYGTLAVTSLALVSYQLAGGAIEMRPLEVLDLG